MRNKINGNVSLIIAIFYITVKKHIIILFSEPKKPLPQLIDWFSD